MPLVRGIAREHIAQNLHFTPGPSASKRSRAGPPGVDRAASRCARRVLHNSWVTSGWEIGENDSRARVVLSIRSDEADCANYLDFNGSTRPDG